ncbi:hypothetical protein ACIHCX_01430 [Streptomyces sp. NPDC052043]|uniref:hypothetical protein n=1 Tax=Streptomyces sp. NPDC052043 TaxID=3365684 RepID=UPI0037D11E93
MELRGGVDHGPAEAGRRQRWASAALVVAGLALLPWLLVLAGCVPGGSGPVRWTTAWVGLDALESLGLVVTGLLLARGDARRCVTAAATATLLVADAWFDTTTASAGEAGAALAMAFCAELPLAAVCALVACRALPGRGR